MKYRSSFWIGIGLVFFCLFFYFYLTPYQIDYYRGKLNMSGFPTHFYPNFLVVLLFICSLILIYRSLSSYAQEKGVDKFSFHLRPIILSGTFFGYIVLLDLFGFLISTPVFLVVMMLLLGAKNLIKIILVTGIFIPFVYYLFNWFLRLLLPVGRLIY